MQILKATLSEQKPSQPCVETTLASKLNSISIKASSERTGSMTTNQAQSANRPNHMPMQHTSNSSVIFRVVAAHPLYTTEDNTAESNTAQSNKGDIPKIITIDRNHCPLHSIDSDDDSLLG